MSRGRLAIGGLAAVVAAAALLLGGAFGGRAAPAPVAASADALGSGFAAGDTRSVVARLQASLRRVPDDVHALDLLGLAYQQRARETGDPAFYPKSAGLLREALRLAPHDLLATSGLGSLALARHRFREALVLGERARALSPTTARSYGVIGDALVEVGRYGDAFRAFDTYARLKPGLGSYARIAYARELTGDVAGAEQAMRLALDSAIGEAEPTAWVDWQLGRLAWSRGDLARAAHEYHASLRAFPNYVYALDALAQVEAARGRLAAAISLERQAADEIPLPQFVGSLADLYDVAGRPRLAREQAATVAAIERLLRANGVRTDLEAALFDADHGRPNVALARAAERARPSIDGDDVLAWTLARSGRCADALPWSQRSLRLGTHDALKLFHRGWIERCLGRRDDARRSFRRALELNPHFSLRWSPIARRFSR